MIALNLDHAVANRAARSTGLLHCFGQELLLRQTDADQARLQLVGFAKDRWIRACRVRCCSRRATQASGMKLSLPPAVPFAANLIREDPSNPDVPSATRVIPLRPDEPPDTEIPEGIVTPPTKK